MSNNTNQNASPTDPFSVVLTKLEIEVLLGMLDLAVKHGGLPVAVNAVALHQKIQQAKPLVRVAAATDVPNASEQSLR